MLLLLGYWRFMLATIREDKSKLASERSVIPVSSL